MRFAALAAVLAAAPAFAQETPPALRPTRDVAVTYRMPNPPVPGLEVRLRTLVSAATGRQRQENSGLVGITDPQGKRRWMFSTNRGDGLFGRVLEQPVDDAELGLEEVARDPDFRVTRLGTDSVAGIACTLWRMREVQEPEEDATELCLAADGVMLRSQARRQGMTELLEAIAVDYAPLDPALFSPPAGWPLQRQDPAGR